MSARLHQNVDPKAVRGRRDGQLVLQHHGDHGGAERGADPLPDLERARRARHLRGWSMSR